jgi:nucleoside-diphosphate-sugar epimerase
MGAAEKHPLTRIVILGAKGQIGSVIHRYLQQHHPEVPLKACIRQVRDKQPPTDYMVFHPFTDNWQKLGKADVLINCIGITKENKHYTFEQAHIELTKLILRHRQAIGNPKIIQISALGADAGNPVPFLSTKGKADELLLMSSRIVVVRPSVVCTPNTMLVQKLKWLGSISRYFMNNLPFPERILHTRLQPVMPEDLAAIVAKLCFSDNHPALIHAVGPEEFTIQELVRLANLKISLLPVNTGLFEPCIKVMSDLFPDLLSRQQYELLLQNNVASSRPAEILLERTVQSTEEFWKQSCKVQSPTPSACINL